MGRDVVVITLASLVESTKPVFQQTGITDYTVRLAPRDWVRVYEDLLNVRHFSAWPLRPEPAGVFRFHQMVAWECEAEPDALSVADITITGVADHLVPEGETRLLPCVPGMGELDLLLEAYHR